MNTSQAPAIRTTVLAAPRWGGWWAGWDCTEVALWGMALGLLALAVGG